MLAGTHARAYVSAGSNIEPEKNLGNAIAELRRRFGDLELSTVYRTAAVGFDGDDFLNLALSFTTRRTVDEVVAELDEIEYAAGRRRGGERFSSRTLDLDLLLFADAVIDTPDLQLPRADILEYAFVLGPLAEIAPDLVHPLERVTIGELWSRFDRGGQAMEPLATGLG
jgi:2-amino-4-hydroxy-6-hydroxymethyldihydropteridine diphosphokinase